MSIFPGDHRYVDLEKRISILEEKIMSIQGIPRRKVGPRKPEVSIPKGWLYPAQFSKKYKFISATMVSRLIREKQDFFKKKVLYSGGRVYMDPVDVAIYFETASDLSSRLLNQYRNWREVSADVGMISTQAKDRLSINCELVGGLY